MEDGVLYQKLGNVCWFTNLEHEKRIEKIPLFKKYTKEEYPHYDNYDAINVDKLEYIPVDYDGKIGVPITYLHKYNPNQFQIIGHEHDLNGDGSGKSLQDFKVNGKGKFKRIIIKKVSELPNL